MRLRVLVLSAVVLVPAIVFGQTKGTAADEEAIRGVAASFERAWNQHDMKALSILVAEEADFVNVAGTWLKSRKEFEEAHTRIHQLQMKESVLTNKSTHIRFVRPDIAVVHLEWSLKGDKDPDGKPRPPRDGIFTWIVEKRNGKWSIIVAHNTNLRDPATGR